MTIRDMIPERRRMSRTVRKMCLWSGVGKSWTVGRKSLSKAPSFRCVAGTTTTITAKELSDAGWSYLPRQDGCPRVCG